LLSQLTPEQIFDGLAISVNGPRAWDLDMAIDVTLADHDANYRLALRNGVLVQRRVPADASTASVTIKLDNAFRLLMMAMGDFSSPGVEISGEQAALQQFLGVLDRPDPSFNIITP
jgi:alkyl sulfatase BDS1-like metallo-beta-lactamase superfamily hydrolase